MDALTIQKSREHVLPVSSSAHLCCFNAGLTKINRLVRKERQVLVRRILFNIRVCRAKQGDQDVDENNGGEEVPRIVDDQAKGVPEPVIWSVEIG